MSQPFCGSPRLASMLPRMPLADRERDLVVEAVAGQRRVVGLDVDAILVLEPVADEEAVDGRHVVVVLVLGRLHRLRFDQELAAEPDAVLVLRDEVQEPGELGALALEVRVQERVVALAAAPQDVVLATEALGHLEHVLDLRRGVGEHLGVGVGGGAGLVARMGEQVGRPPQQPDAGPLLVAGGVVAQRIEGGPELREARRSRARRPGRGSSSTGSRSSRRTRRPRPSWSGRHPSGRRSRRATADPASRRRTCPRPPRRTSARSRRPVAGGLPCACRGRAGRGRRPCRRAARSTSGRRSGSVPGPR